MMHDALSSQVSMPLDLPQMMPSVPPPSNARRLEIYVKQAHETLEQRKETRLDIPETQN